MATPNLGLDEMPSTSFSPSVPFNNDMQALDALIQLSVIALTDTPPTTTSGDVGKRWLVGNSPTGAWVGSADKIALCVGANLWRYFTPQDGWRAGTSGGTDYRYNTSTGNWEVQASLTNPMTTAGDLIVGGTGGTPTRLGVGTDGEVLKLVAGVPSWETDSAAATVQAIIVACSDETTALTTGTAKVTFRMPFAFTLSAVRASLTTPQTSGSIVTVDINEGGSSILSTKITIDNTEKTSTTAATAPVISDTSLADDAEITVDIDQIGDSTAKGLKVYLIGTKT